MDKLQRVLNKAYSQRLSEERKAKGLYGTVILPKGQRKIQLLPIQNLFYGNPQTPPRLKMLLEQIKRINDMEDGAFFLGGNLFYYPAGTTEEKTNFAQIFANELSEVLRVADKRKILFMYDGITETKYLDDRKLKWPIPTSKLVAENLGISDRYYGDIKVELNFVFNNDLTGNENRYMTSLFTSTAPISATTNAIATKLTKLSNSNVEKHLIVDTSSSRFYTKKRIITASSKDRGLSYFREQTLISPTGYTDMPQIAPSQKVDRYGINQRYIELKIEEKNPALHQDSIRTTNTIKDDPFDRTAICLTIGVNHDTYIDEELCKKLNDVALENMVMKEDLEMSIDFHVDKSYKTKESEIYRTSKPAQPEAKPSPRTEQYTFE